MANDEYILLQVRLKNENEKAVEVHDVEVLYNPRQG